MKTQAKRFVDVIEKLLKDKNTDEVSNLLGWTCGTLGKGYDYEEMQSTIAEDFQDWLDGKADYMK